ncbi:uncharacterized protein LOC125760003 [Rhipicephalus sanguineus]|uniref:uncharacterized protein LOC125760003 n=1 Tax=Rhipicephalus sanguineus TaxID=34632 RepID=UPI0020C58BAD|nr:uncharacterized protein LOC125760003 [Rhipicephalus sanguineus]
MRLNDAPEHSGQRRGDVGEVLADFKLHHPAVRSYAQLATSLEPLDALREVTVASTRGDHYGSLESLVNFVHIKPMNHASQREQIEGSKLFCPVGGTVLRQRPSVLTLTACTGAA